jgi:hypothetical protein
VHPRLSDDSRIDLLRRLIATGSAIARTRRKPTLFEALDVLHLEQPHSDFLAWLLDESGPLKDMWLLRRLLDHVAPDMDWPGVPTIEREVQNDGGRADIVVRWDDFTLIIENKVWSVEGEGQATRYLHGFKLQTKDDGRLIYLTPRGKWPQSVLPSDDRVVAMSYGQLAAILAEGPAESVDDARGSVFAKEFHNCILRLLKVRVDMTKPSVSEVSKLLLANARLLHDIKESAKDESAEFIDWLYFEAERRLLPILGPEMVAHRMKDGILLRLPEWKTGEIEFGISYAMRADPRRRLITQQPVDPWVGVAVFLLDGSEKKSLCKPVTELLTSSLMKIWPHRADFTKPELSWPLWRYVPIADGNLDQWSDQVLALMEEMAQVLTPVLTRSSTCLASASKLPTLN